MRVFTRFIFVDLVANSVEFSGFRKQKTYTAYDRFQGNCPYGEIPTGVFLGLGAGRETALASAGYVSILHPEILGVIN